MAITILGDRSMPGLWDNWENPLKKRPLSELSRREATIRRTLESPLEQHRRLGEFVLGLFQGVRRLVD